MTYAQGRRSSTRGSWSPRPAAASQKMQPPTLPLAPVTYESLQGVQRRSISRQSSVISRQSISRQSIGESQIDDCRLSTVDGRLLHGEGVGGGGGVGRSHAS